MPNLRLLPALLLLSLSACTQAPAPAQGNAPVPTPAVARAAAAQEPESREIPGLEDPLPDTLRRATLYAWAWHAARSLHDRDFSAISDAGHRNLIRLRNWASVHQIHDDSTGRLLVQINPPEYDRFLMQHYKDWIPSRGMGIFIPALGISLGGAPDPAWRFHTRD